MGSWVLILKTQVLNFKEKLGFFGFGSNLGSIPYNKLFKKIIYEKFAISLYPYFKF